MLFCGAPWRQMCTEQSHKSHDKFHHTKCVDVTVQSAAMHHCEPLNRSWTVCKTTGQTNDRIIFPDLFSFRFSKVYKKKTFPQTQIKFSQILIVTKNKNKTKKNSVSSCLVNRIHSVKWTLLIKWINGQSCCGLLLSGNWQQETRSAFLSRAVLETSAVTEEVQGVCERGGAWNKRCIRGMLLCVVCYSIMQRLWVFFLLFLLLRLVSLYLLISRTSE